MTAMALPRTVLVKQHFPDRRIADIPAEVQKQLSSSSLGANLKPGSRVAIGVGQPRAFRTSPPLCGRWWITGSRVACIRSSSRPWVATELPRPKAKPMCWRITASTKRPSARPVISHLDVVSVGKTADGIEAFLDKNAFESDGVMLIGRVKWHTDFAGAIESGLFKMMAIGLGKFAGAQNYHTHAFTKGLEHVIPRRGPAGALVRPDSGWLSDPGRRLSQHGEAGSGARGEHGEARRGIAGAHQELDGACAVQPGHSDHRRDRQEHLRRRDGYEGGQPFGAGALQSVAEHAALPAPVRA